MEPRPGHVRSSLLAAWSTGLVPRVGEAVSGKLFCGRTPKTILHKFQVLQQSVVRPKKRTRCSYCRCVCGAISCQPQHRSEQYAICSCCPARFHGIPSDSHVNESPPRHPAGSRETPREVPREPVGAMGCRGCPWELTCECRGVLTGVRRRASIRSRGVQR